ncbi:Mini-ribonuclease 3 [Lacticaseibacillus hulanensis]|uniref:Mini-ribonuclease 3 n=1 Tax=Lacticaseibacillus hulanensis TaxID=2493111 RepID=UPI000FDBADBD|nr:ribonuclease III domain-containing protein [Lacticaseibacillus hulanensis]
MSVNPEMLNGVALAYLGDAVYEVFIRTRMLERGITKPAQLQKAAKNFVSAKAQAALIDGMEQGGILSDDEWAMYKHGRNAKSYTHAKNTDVVTYRISTGFEALFGTLQMLGRTDRVAELAHWCIEYVENGGTGHGKLEQ